MKKTILIILVALTIIGTLCYAGIKFLDSEEKPVAEITGGLPAGSNFEIVKILTIDVSKSPSTVQGVTTVAHGLGYKPAYMAFISNIGDLEIYYQTPYTQLSSSTGAVTFKADIVTDSDSVNCYVITPSGGSGYAGGYGARFYVYLLRQPVPS